MPSLDGMGTVRDGRKPREPTSWHLSLPLTHPSGNTVLSYWEWIRLNPCPAPNRRTVVCRSTWYVLVNILSVFTCTLILVTQRVFFPLWGAEVPRLESVRLQSVLYFKSRIQWFWINSLGIQATPIVASAMWLSPVESADLFMFELSHLKIFFKIIVIRPEARPFCY